MRTIVESRWKVCKRPLYYELFSSVFNVFNFIFRQGLTLSSKLECSGLILAHTKSFYKLCHTRFSLSLVKEGSLVPFDS